jgi:hypothetical protein
VSEQRFYGEVVQPAELLAAIRTAGAAAWARGAAPDAPQPAPLTPRPVAPTVMRPASTPPAIPVFAKATPSVAASAPMPAVTAPMVPAGLSDTIAPCIPGLWPVAIRCPGHPQVEFATDESGRLHLLAWIDQAVALRPARAWAHRNAAMLRAGFPGLAADPLPLVEHLVFPDATCAVEWHHTGVRLHHLVRAATGWMHVPLNDERSMQP